MSEAVVMSPAFRRFRNQLCLLRGFDLDKLERAGVITGGRIEFRSMELNSLRFFLCLDSDRAAALFRLIEAGLKPELRDPLYDDGSNA